jgi:putative endonuclease
MTYWVYILSSGPIGTLYVGMTNSLFRRVGEHKRKDRPRFTTRYGVDRLVFYRGFGEVTQEGPVDPAIMGPGLPLRGNRNDI